MPNLQIELLGHFFLCYDGEPLARLYQARQQELLAYLVLHRSVPQARHYLAFLFWPDSSESQARTNLRQLLHDLRRALPAADKFLQLDAQSVQWRADAPFTLDVADFERALAEAGNPATDSALLERAVQGYAGALLPGCYADWILPERERLSQNYEQALVRLVVLLEERRDYARALRHGQRLLRHDPLHEATYLRMMRLHALNGDRASALHTYHICATMLGRELGVEPDDEMQAAYEHLLNLHAPPVMRGVARSARAKGSHLIGRQAEWRRLQAVWHSAVRGRVHFVLVSGEAGMGKTHLAQEMLSWAGQQGIATAYTRAYAAVGVGGLAYAPVINWLRSDVLQQILVRLDSVWLTELARLCPELLVERPDLNRPEPLTERWQRQRLFEALARTFLAVNAPILLVLDDLQWCDLETLEWLHYLLRYAHGMGAQHQPPARLLVLGTMRPEEVDSTHPLTALLLNLRRTDLLTELMLAPLDGQETAALAAQVAERELDSEARHRLYQATEGNPLFVVETMRASSGEQGRGIGPFSLPPKVQAVIQARLAQLSPSSRELACLAAVVGRSFTFPVLAQASALAEDVLIRGLDELWQRRIIREQGENAYDFSHDRIRDVAYAEASLARRRFLHQRVAQALEALHRDDLGTVSDQLGRHYEQALQLEKAVKYYRQAAATSAELYAFESVLLSLERMLILLGKLPATAEGIRQQIESWIETANTLIFTKGWMAIERKQALDRAYELAKQIGDEAHQLEAVLGLHGYYANRGEWYTVYVISQEMVLLAEKLEEPRQLCQAYHGMANTYMHRGEFLASLQYQRKVIAIETELGPPESDGLSPRSRMAEALWFCGYPEQAQRLAAETIRLAAAQQHPFGRVHVQGLIMFLAQHCGDVAAVQRLAHENAELCVRYGFPNYARDAQLFEGWVMVQNGAVQQGLQQMAEVIAIQQQQGDGFYQPYFLALLAEAQVKNGQLLAALATVERALQLVAELGDQSWQAELLRCAGELRYQIDPWDAHVVELYGEALDVARRQHAKSLELRAAMSLAALWQQHGARQQARDLLSGVYEWFTEGFDTPDLQRARTLLTDLGSA